MKTKTIIAKPVSSRCNLRCSYCYNATEFRKHDRIPMMTIRLVEQLHERVPELGTNRVTIIWHGGEPLIRGTDFYEEVVSIQKRLTEKFPGLRIRNDIQTNATLLTEEWAQFFVTNGWSVGTSLDGPKSLHDAFRVDARGKGTFDRVMAGIKCAQAAGVAIGFIAVVTSETLEYSPKELYDFWMSVSPRFAISPCWEAPVNGVSPRYVVDPRGYLTFLKELFDIWWRDDNPSMVIRPFNGLVQALLGGRGPTCAYNGNCEGFLSVDADGSAYPCGKFAGVPELQLGNISEQSFPAINCSRIRQDYLAIANSMPNECRSCRWLKVCNNGCTYDRCISGGEFEALSPFCAVRKGIFGHVDAAIKRTEGWTK
ncbi:MAG: radical SAM protein [candidate division WWE3 bacterium]|nr:radical SAM protein [candidate division WWE3 bacterium]